MYFTDSTNVLTQIFPLLSGPNRAQVRQPAAEGRERGSHTSHQQTVQVKGRPALLPGVGGHTHPDMALWMSHDVPSSCYTLSIGLLKRERERKDPVPAGTFEHPKRILQEFFFPRQSFCAM